MKHVVGALVAWALIHGFAWGEVSAPAAYSVGEWIEKLGDENYQTRSEASRRLWDIGEPALPSLRAAVRGRDPEVVQRASELIGNIEAGVRPDADRETLALVAEYRAGNEAQKRGALMKLRKKQSWRLILKLYGSEPSGDVRKALRHTVDGIATLAARDAMLAGHDEEALALLRMAPRDEVSLLALAAFHRVHGTLKKELSTVAKDDAEWHVALLRAAGRISEAHSLARKSGMDEIASTMAVLDGDPIPWLRQSNVDREGGAAYELYLKLAMARWNGQPADAAAEEALRQMLRDNDESSVEAACAAYYFLGEPDKADPEYRKLDRQRAFLYFDSMERVDDALRVLGLDPGQPDYSGWLAKQIVVDGEGQMRDDVISTVALLLGFVEQRGLRQMQGDRLDAVVLERLRPHPQLFAELLGELRGGMRSTPSLATIRRLAHEFAGDDPDKWASLVSVIFQNGRDQDAWWDWLIRRSPDLTPAERFDLMIDLFHPADATGAGRSNCLDAAWEIVARQQPENESKELNMLTNLAADVMDSETGLKAWHAWKRRPAEKNRLFEMWGFLTAHGRWDEAADYNLQLVGKNPAGVQFRANAAACLWRAGRSKQALEQESMLLRLAIGSPESSLMIGDIYAGLGEVARSRDWYQRALLESTSVHTFRLALYRQAANQMASGDWQRAAAATEVICAMESGRDAQGVSAVDRLRLRMHADFCRALARRQQDRAESLAILQRCHRVLQLDGLLADEFFPALRQAGFAAEQQAMFETTWHGLQDLIQRFPGCVNTRNTAAWTAARAGHRLDEAEAQVTIALQKSPNQASYLDTMAEIQFAKGRTKLAVEWSDRSLLASPNTDVLWRQNARFRGLTGKR